MTCEPNARPIVAIQILRAIAALAVLIAHLHHSFIQVPGGIDFGIGSAGVELFFVISGFIMVHTCWQMFAQRGVSMNFFLRRLARIVPLYWVASLVHLSGVLYTQPLSQADSSWGHIINSFLFMPSPPPGGELTPFLGVGWTLNHEMFFLCGLCADVGVPAWHCYYSCGGHSHSGRQRHYIAALLVGSHRV